MLTLAEVSARMEIHDALMRYARGMDRWDGDLVESAYFPDAVDTRSYRPALRSPRELAESARTGFGSPPEPSQHHLTNILIDVDVEAGVADVESYAIIFHPVAAAPDPGDAATEAPSEMRWIGARYLDRFECRDGEWRIARRVVVADWARADLYGAPAPLFSEWQGGLRPGLREADPSFTLHRSQE